MEKIKSMKKKNIYSKPECVDLGQVASVEGADCLPGTTANVGCNTGNLAATGCNPNGNNPTWDFQCKPGGVANSDCMVGSWAGTGCFGGSTAQGGQTCSSGTFVM